MNEEDKKQLLDKGYVAIPNFWDDCTVQAWKDLWPQLRYNAETNTTEEMRGYSDKDGNMWNVQNALKSTFRGRETIKQVEKYFQKINPELKFLKDRYVYQIDGRQGYRPHQDNFISFHGLITKEMYTVSIYFTDVDANTGCVWVEDIEPKRTENLRLCEKGCVTNNKCICVRTQFRIEDMANWRGHTLMPMSLPAGGALIIDGCILHGSSHNLSNKPRQSLTLVFGVVDEKDRSTPDIDQDYNRRIYYRKIYESKYPKHSPKIKL